MDRNKIVSDKNKETLQNPYTKGAEGRKEWNDRYFNMKTEIKYWKYAFFFVMFILLILIFVVAKIATESHVEPYVVETNNGFPIAIKPMEKLSAKNQMIINYAINQFIINSKSVVTDTNAEKNLLNKVYAYAADDTLKFLNEYYQNNDPFSLATKSTVSIKIINSMPLSDNTWQVIWDESKLNSNGNIENVTRWMAELTYKFGNVNPKFINDNPFGFYITNLTWAQSQN